MSMRYNFIGVILILIVGCSSKQKDYPVNINLIPGKYCHSVDSRDSIFIYSDNTYKHTYNRTDGKLNSQISTWYYNSKTKDIFFKSFLFFNDYESESGDYNGSWPSNISIGDKGEIKLRYSESVYYVKVQ
jgi:hypothetical protein